MSISLAVFLIRTSTSARSRLLYVRLLASVLPWLIVNGKPLIFELCAETHSEKKGILEIKNPTLDFLNVPMGYVIYFFILIYFFFLDDAYCLSIRNQKCRGN